DCTYVLQADAVDETGRSGSPKALTVKLNRIKPIAPSDFEGGRNENANRVDVQWTGNPECDVEHYKVYRGTTPSNVTTPVTCSGAGSALLAKDAAECLDEGAPAGTLYYKVVALDRAPGGVLRDGAPSDLLAVPPAGGNQKPSAPGNVTACTGGAPGCNGPDGTPATSGVTVVRFDPATDSDGTIASYRIYRNGTSYSNRHGVFFSTEGATGLAWLEHDMPGGPHEYRVSAVDDKFAESDLSAPVSL
ncbi:MAG TPA: hypothetical protein VER33_05700, partial [Polyangiaceae bacterium]|nr:hypothetical protein [Polyangiaceae bacterium]